MRNKNAGKHPSYDKRNMSEEARKNKLEYDKKHSATPEAKKKRAECNKKRKEAKSKGINTKGKDASHTSRGLIFKLTKSNRGSKTDSAGDRRARGKKNE